MDNRDILQMEIDKARSSLTLASREAIDAIDWRSVIAGMNKKYNPDQLENLETETELLLCGLLAPEYYAKELENRMKLAKPEVDALISDLDKLIFKKIQDLLIKGVREEPIIFDPRFKTLSQDIQNAIARSNWQSKLYKIGEKNKLPIDKMAFLEEATVKVILGTISPSTYESNLFEALSKLEKDEIKEIIAEVNLNIMKAIRGFEQKQQIEKVAQVDDDEVPAPPYKTSSDNSMPVPQPPKTETKIYKDAGIEMVATKKEEAPALVGVYNDKISAKEDASFAKSGVELVSDKLIMPTSSKSVYSDHSIPKLGKVNLVKNDGVQDSATKIIHDQYHESID